MAVDHYENFPVASFLLPPHLREAVAALYYFARTADDIADEGKLSAEERLTGLARYQLGLDRIERGEADPDPIFQRLGRAVKAHDLQVPLLRDLLDAFAQDVHKQRYANYAELLDYCRRSANPVGRLLLRLYKAESPLQLEQSDAICTSLQLINHWQDVAVDWYKPRVYLPQEDLDRFNVSDAHIEAGRVDASWIALMRHEVEIARNMMLYGAPLARSLPGRIGLELRLMVCGGLRILEKIEAVGYDVFRRRPQLSAGDWPILLSRALFSYPKQ
ncbi:MAG TPA: squalene synthase HpnC [Rhodocyclaceae bacterium]|jgi:phytoene synthase|nr:squalene synthase HpnC [Rhodocyclaceae bacterium]